MDHLDWQASCAGLLRDLLQLLLAVRPQDHLGLSVAEPGPEVSGAESSQRGSDCRMGGLRRYLATPHAQVRTHDERQLGLHD